MKKSLSLILTLALLVACFVPAVASASEPIVLKAWGAFTFDDQSGITNYADQQTWKEIEKRLGIKVEWTTVSGLERETPFGLLMASNELPDFIVDINPLLLEEFGRKGALIPLNALMEDMPNLQKLFEADVQAKPSITSEDGNVYFFPRLMEPATRYWPGLMIRKDWLDELGLALPTTTDEYFDALLAIKEGIPGVTKAFTGTDSTEGALRTLIWAFGVGARGTGNGNDDFFVEDDVIKFGANDPRYRDALAYLNKMYAAGLIDTEMTTNQATNTRTNMVTGASASTFGSFSGNLSAFNGLLEADGKGTPLVPLAPLYGPTGERTSMGHHTSIDLGYGGAITSTSDKAEAVVKLFDYLYSDEGRELLYWGVEGETFEMVDGTRQFTEKVTTSELGTMSYLNNYSANTSCFPSALLLEFYHATLSEIARAGNLETTEISQANDKKVPALRYSADEIATVNAILVDLKSYVDESMWAFILGTQDINDDAAWDTYVKGFDRLRLEELTGLYNAAYTRFLAAK